MRQRGRPRPSTESMAASTHRRAKIPGIDGTTASGRRSCFTPAAASRSSRARRAIASSVTGAVFDRGDQQPARGLGLSALECVSAGLNQFVALALPLGQGAACALDVGAGACMPAVQKEHSRPDVDGEIVVAGEVVIEPAKKELFDASLALVFRHLSRGGIYFGSQRIDHQVAGTRK